MAIIVDCMTVGELNKENTGCICGKTTLIGWPLNQIDLYVTIHADPVGNL